MFVLELSKASGVCLAAFVDGELAGYLVCSRYDTVWHIMNVAVDPDRRRHGIASTLLTRAVRARRRPGRAVHARGAALQRRARSRSTSASASAPAGVRRRYYADNGEDAVVMWRTPATLRGRSTTSRTRRRLILALETSCDDTCAAVVTDAGEMLANVVSSQGVHDRFGGVVPEIASRHHLELVNAVVDDALRRAGATLGDVTRVAVTQGPGLVGALLVGVATAKGLAAARRLPLAAGRPPPGPRRGELPRARTRSSRRSCA